MREIHENNNIEYSSPVLKVERPYYGQEQLNTELNYSKPKTDACEVLRSKLCSINVRQSIMGLFPVFAWLSQYNIRKDLIHDIISGFTVAIMHIPQGMGYALLANVPPVAGIYTAFFPVLVYFVLGTSRHNSMGTFAVVSIMVGKSVLTLSDIHIPQYNSTSQNDVTLDVARHTPIEVATAVTFLVGLILLGMFVFRLGIISTLLSETLVSGFTTGAAMHVLFSQLKDLLGIKFTAFTGYFQIINITIEVFKQITLGNVNWAAVVISTITITIIATNNDYLKPVIAKKCIIPIPIELIAVVAGALISQFFDLKEVYSVKTIEHIPIGFPDFTMPKVDLFSSLIVDAFTIAMVSYTVSVSMGLIFAQKENYEIDFNQELLAMGTGNILGSFFSCIPVSASLSRSTIQHTVGGKTQIASIISCGLLAIILLYIGKFFEPLPTCVLASIIVVALKGMFLQAKDFLKFWKLSRLDAIVWMVTFLVVVFIAIDIGLAVGIGLSLSCIFIRGMKPYTCLLGNVPRTDLYLNINRYKSAEEIRYIKIFHFCGSLNFASRGTFKTELCSLLGIDMAKEIRRETKKNSINNKYEPLPIKCLIIDFSALSYIDPSGVSYLKLLINEFEKLSVIVYIAGCSCPSYEIMKKCGLTESASQYFKYYPTVHDAVHHAKENIAPISVICEYR